MLQIIITPCLLGFDVKTRSGAFERSLGIVESFGDIVRDLIFTEGDFVVVVK